MSGVLKYNNLQFTDYRYKEGDVITFSMSLNGPYGVGVICGCDGEMELLGRSWIVRLQEWHSATRPEFYPFSCITVFDYHIVLAQSRMRELQKTLKKTTDEESLNRFLTERTPNRTPAQSGGTYY
jgi:hypothetical protein